MDIEKIAALNATHKLETEKKTENKKNKSEKVQSKVDSDLKNEAEGSVRISSRAKKLQESESILRNALQQLKKLDDTLKPDLEEINQKIYSNAYSSREVDEIIASNIFSDERIVASLEKMKERINLVERLKDMDEGSSLDQEKILSVQEKIKSGFYEREGIAEKTAENIIADLI